MSVKKTACLSLRRLAWIPVLGTVTMLTACYVVPVNPNTGQPYPVQHTSQAVIPLPINTNTILQAKLYPLNVQATKAGALTATATDAHNGRGVFSVNFMGETLQGDASRVDANYPAFGRIYREVLGVGSDSGRGGRRGIANAFGHNGTGVQCEYHMSSNDIGTGVCLFSNGAKYQMHFGG
jgi:hypothetical protein